MREWNVAGNGKFGRLAKSAGLCRTPHNNTRELAQTGKEKPQLITVGASVLVEVERIELSSGSLERRNLHTYPFRSNFHSHSVAETAKNCLRAMSEKSHPRTLTCIREPARRVDAQLHTFRRSVSERAVASVL